MSKKKNSTSTSTSTILIATGNSGKSVWRLVQGTEGCTCTDFQIQDGLTGRPVWKFKDFHTAYAQFKKLCKVRVTLSDK